MISESIGGCRLVVEWPSEWVVEQGSGRVNERVSERVSG